MNRLIEAIKLWWSMLTSTPEQRIAELPETPRQWWEGMMTFFETFDGRRAILVNGHLFTEVGGQWTHEQVNLWAASQSQPSSIDVHQCPSQEQP